MVKITLQNVMEHSHTGIQMSKPVTAAICCQWRTGFAVVYPLKPRPENQFTACRDYKENRENADRCRLNFSKRK